jgi:hypothetical protein
LAIWPQRSHQTPSLCKFDVFFNPTGNGVQGIAFDVTIMLTCWRLNLLTVGRKTSRWHNLPQTSPMSVRENYAFIPRAQPPLLPHMVRASNSPSTRYLRLGRIVALICSYAYDGISAVLCSEERANRCTGHSSKQLPEAGQRVGVLIEWGWTCLQRKLQ